MGKEIFFISRPEEISRVTQFFEAVGGLLHIASPVVMRINLALEEAINNVIKYAYPAGEPYEITLKINVEDDELVCTLIDNGIAFDPTLIKETNLKRPLEQQLLDTLGISLMRKIMDEISYQCTEDGNCLVMKKKINVNAEVEKTMNINICKVEGATIIAVEGRLDTANAREFDTIIQPLLAEKKLQVIINFENLSYICSAGIRSLILLQKSVQKNKGCLVLEAMQPDIYKIFEMTGCASIFTIRH